MTTGRNSEYLPDDFADEVAQHRFGDQVVGDDAVAHRPADDDAAGRAAEHLPRVRADGHDAVVGRRVGDDRRLVEHDAAAFDIDQHVGRAEVDADVFAKEEREDRHGEAISYRLVEHQQGLQGASRRECKDTELSVASG